MNIYVITHDGKISQEGFSSFKHAENWVVERIKFVTKNIDFEDGERRFVQSGWNFTYMVNKQLHEYSINVVSINEKL